MPVSLYDPKEVSILIAGVPVIGIADGTFLEISQRVDSFCMRIGVSGEVARLQCGDRTAIIRLVLQQSSEMNDFLSLLHQADIAIPFGFAVFPVLVKDFQGSTLAIAPSAWIRRFSNITYSNGVEVREWILNTDNMAINVGGNVEV